MQLGRDDQVLGLIAWVFGAPSPYWLSETRCFLSHVCHVPTPCWLSQKLCVFSHVYHVQVRIREQLFHSVD